MPNHNWRGVARWLSGHHRGLTPPGLWAWFPALRVCGTCMFSPCLWEVGESLCPVNEVCNGLASHPGYALPLHSLRDWLQKKKNKKILNYTSNYGKWMDNGEITQPCKTSGVLPIILYRVKMQGNASHILIFSRLLSWIFGAVHDDTTPTLQSMSNKLRDCLIRHTHRRVSQMSGTSALNTLEFTAALAHSWKQSHDLY